MEELQVIDKILSQLEARLRPENRWSGARGLPPAVCLPPEEPRGLGMVDGYQTSKGRLGAPG